MQKAKQAVANFVSQDGKHKTTVDQDVRKAVTDEQIHPHRHEDVTTALHKEVHQDHHHTAVQPVNVKETLPEKHSQNVIPVEHKTVKHNNEQEVQTKLQQEANKYKDSSATHHTTHSVSTAPAVQTEDIHHHVHEHIQPVIQKETIAPHVVHTTVPIHETHHAPAIHHGVTTLPTKSIEEFSGDGSVLQGQQTVQIKDFEGCPTVDGKNIHSVGSNGGHHGAAGLSHESTSAAKTQSANNRHATVESSSAQHDSINGRNDIANGRNANATASKTVNPSLKNSNATNLESDHSRDPAQIGTNGKTVAKNHSSGISQNTSEATRTSSGATSSSWLDKLNPLKDADGDGKRGMFD